MYPKIEHVIVETKAEKCLHELYGGRVYYINATEQGVNSGVYPLHFCFIQERAYTNFRVPYYRRSKSRRSVVPGFLPSLELVTFKNKGYKLAMFKDKNVRKECVEAMYEFLRLYQGDFKSLNHMIREILEKFELKFGFFLLFEVLMYLNEIKREHYPIMAEIQQELRKNINIKRRIHF